MIFFEVLLGLYFLWGFILAMIPICTPKFAKDAIEDSEYDRFAKDTMLDLFENHKVVMFILTILFGGIGTIVTVWKG